MNKVQEAALSYIKKGWPVLALHSIKDKKCTCNKEKCESPGKHPRWHKSLLPHGVKSATTDEKIIKKWWTMWPDANIGIACGPQSFDVLDIDIDKNTGEEIGEIALAEIEKRNNDKLPETVEQITGSGGRQIFFKYTGKIEKNESRFADGLDNRTTGGYVVVPPSLHISGKKYEWEAAHHPDETELVEPPEWLIKLINTGHREITKEEKGTKNKPDWVQDALLGVRIGKRDQTCTKLAGYYLRLFKGDKQQTRLILSSWNDRNEPPLDQKEVDKVVESIGKKHKIIALSEIIGFEIFQIEIVRRDTHDLDYLFYLHAGIAKMSSQDVLSPAFFTRRIFELTRRPPNLTAYTTKKKHVWLDAIGDAMTEATEIQTAIDETTDEPVIDAINHYLRNPSDDIRLLDSSPIVVDGMILVKIKALRNHIRGQGEKVTAKEIGGILRNKLRFKNERMRIGNTQERVWKKPLEKWKWI